MAVKLLAAVLLSLIATAGAMAAAALVIARLPNNHFVIERDNAPEGSTARVVRNVIGTALMLTGFVMILIPGPGLLTLLIGLTLTTFPGKRKIERRLASNPKILASINDLRRKCGKEPMLPPV